MSVDSFKSLNELVINSKKYKFYDIKKVADGIGVDLSKMPFSMKVILENIVRKEDGKDITKNTISDFFKWIQNSGKSNLELSFYPARVLMQDFTGIPAIVDLATMRHKANSVGADPKSINPTVPVHLVVDHSIQVDNYGQKDSERKNFELEMSRNYERYRLLKWAQKNFNNLTIFPPRSGICHQINLEHIAPVVFVENGSSDESFIYPDTVVGTDSHTTMINGAAVLGWGVGGIEAEAVMLGGSISMIQPEVVGFELTGSSLPGVTSTDIVLTVTQMLRKLGVVNKFVEFYGDGLDSLSLADRATIANMAPEYGATCGIFPIDQKLLDYMRLTGRTEEQISIVEQYARSQSMWREYGEKSNAIYTTTIQLDLSKVEPSVAGPKRPQDRLSLGSVGANFKSMLAESGIEQQNIDCNNDQLTHGSVAIAAITSCTNTSNPSVIIGAGILAKKAVELGLKVKPFVKTSLSPGSLVVDEYLMKSGLKKYLDELGFTTAGYGCMTCIGSSGPLNEDIEKKIKDDKLSVASVLSGNRNFEGRVHALVKANYLASPPLVVAYAILGNVNVDISSEAIGEVGGKKIYLKDIWPTKQEIEDVLKVSLSREMFVSKYSSILDGPQEWRDIEVPLSDIYEWQDGSTYIEMPPYFDSIQKGKVSSGCKKGFISSILSYIMPGSCGDNDVCNNKDISAFELKSASCLMLLGDSITTDHISPAGNIADGSAAAIYLNSKGTEKKDFNTYGTRRGSHSVMMRGTFANTRIKNEALDKDGPHAKHIPTGKITSVYEAAMLYKESGDDLVIIAGKEYGTGSSRDWAAKGTKLLGIKAVIAESFERIHRSNLVGMGVMPFEFINGEDRKSLGFTGYEKFSINIPDISSLMQNKIVECIVEYQDGKSKTISLKARIDTFSELQFFVDGGIMHFSLKKKISKFL